jgi:twinkle protein
VIKAKPVVHNDVLMLGQQLAHLRHVILHPPSPGRPWTSLPGLTKLLKGLRPGELTVFTGPTGSGKTTLLAQMTLDLAMLDVKPVSTLWGSFEIKNAQLMTTLLHQYVGMKYDEDNRMLHRELDARELLAYTGEFVGLPFSFMDYYGSTDINRVLETMRHMVESAGVQHVVIDNLQFMMTSRELRLGTTGFEKFEEMDHAVALFRDFATRYNVHVTVVIHPKKEKDGERLGISSFYGSSKPTQEADTVLILQKALDGTRSLDVVKNRFDGTTGQVPLTYRKPTKTFVDVTGQDETDYPEEVLEASSG